MQIFDKALLYFNSLIELVRKKNVGEILIMASDIFLSCCVLWMVVSVLRFRTDINKKKCTPGLFSKLCSISVIFYCWQGVVGRQCVNFTSSLLLLFFSSFFFFFFSCYYHCCALDDWLHTKPTNHFNFLKVIVGEFCVALCSWNPFYHRMRIFSFDYYMRQCFG